MEDLVNRRCGWAGTDDLYVKYHDEEWGKLVTADKILFEFLVLESAQAGLAWITILRKREGYKLSLIHILFMSAHRKANFGQWVTPNKRKPKP